MFASSEFDCSVSTVSVGLVEVELEKFSLLSLPFNSKLEEVSFLCVVSRLDISKSIIALLRCQHKKAIMSSSYGSVYDDSHVLMHRGHSS